MASASAVCHLGLLHMQPLQLWLKTRVPWTAWTSGRLSIAVTRGCIEALAPWRNPNFLQPGSPPGVGNLTRGGHTRTHRRSAGERCARGCQLRGSGQSSDPVAHKPIGIGSSLLALKEFQAQLERQHVLIRTDNTSVVAYINRQGGRPFEGFVQAGSDVTAMGGFSPSIHQSNAHPRSF